MFEKTAKSKKPVKVQYRNNLDKPLAVEFVPGKDVRPNSYNPNVQMHKEFLLTLKSIVEEGLDQPVVVNKATGEIVDGEHRWRGWAVAHYLVKNGLWNSGNPDDTTVEKLRRETRDLYSEEFQDLKLPVVYTDLTPEEARVATLRRNRARGVEDYQLLGNVFRELEELGATPMAAPALLMSDDEIRAMTSSAMDLLGGDKLGEGWEPDKKETKPKKRKAKAKDDDEADSGGNDDEGNHRDPDSVFVVHVVYTDQDAQLMRAVLETPANAGQWLLERVREQAALVEENAES